MSFIDVFTAVLYAVVSLFLIAGVLYAIACVVLLAALALKELWYRVRYGRKK